MPRKNTETCPNCNTVFTHSKKSQEYCSKQCLLDAVCMSCRTRHGRGKTTHYAEAGVEFVDGKKHMQLDGKLLCTIEYKRPDRKRYTKGVNLNYLYGMSIEEYEARYNEQEGKCAICAEQQDTLHVDHDHTTELVRGLICNHCNLMLGHAKDDPVRLLRAAAYLKPETGKNKAIKLVEELVGA